MDQLARSPRSFSWAIRRCSHKPSRYRWTITDADGQPIEHATASYPTPQAAIDAAQARADFLNHRAMLGKTPP